MFLLFLKSWWKEIAVAAIVAGGIFYVQNLRSTVVDQKANITSLQMANTILKQNNEKLQTAVAVNNAAIEKLAGGAAQTKKHFDALGLTVKSQSLNLETRLKSILTEKKPQTCQETIQYLLDSAGTFK